MSITVRAREAALTARYIKAARKHGCRVGLARVIIEQARVSGVPISLGFALIEHESGFRKVFGHDPTIFVGAGTVTRAKYLAYKRARGVTGRGGMQGVGEGQLTWWATQDAADKAGGCWKASANVRTAFRTLASNINLAGNRFDGIKAYNGTGPAATTYAHAVSTAASRWHGILS